MSVTAVAPFVVVVGVVSCAAAPPPSWAETPPSSECEALARQATRRVDEVLAAHQHCVNDSDCVAVGHGASCFDHCSTAMSRGGTSALQSIQADVDARECRDFAAQGCHVEVPPCAALPAVRCRQWVCEQGG
jgi:hypothetical protein